MSRAERKEHPRRYQDPRGSRDRRRHPHHHNSAPRPIPAPSSGQSLAVVIVALMAGVVFLVKRMRRAKA